MMVGLGKALLVPRASAGPAYDALAVGWAARVVANGGAEPSAATKLAVSNFCAALRSAGILSKMKAVCLLTPGSLTEALTPLIKTSGGAAYGTELVTNGGFDSNTSGWTAGGGATLSCVSGGQSGNCLKVANSAGSAYAAQAISTQAGVVYKLTLYFKKGTGSGLVKVGTSAGDGTLYSSALYADASWAAKTIYFTATGATTYISLMTDTADSIDCYFDTVSCQVAILCNDPWTNYNFVSGDLTVDGLVGNGSTKYLQSGLIPANCFRTESAGFTVYYVTANNVNAIELGFYRGSGSTIAMQFWGSVIYWDCWAPTGGGRINVNDAGFSGYRSGNRISTTDTKIYHASSTVSHTQIVSGASIYGSPPSDVQISAFCNGYSMNSYSNQRLSFLGMHDGLTSGESAKFYAAIQALRMALGGGYV